MQSRGNNKKIQMSKYMVYIVLAVVFVFFAITLRDNGFASTQNLLNILRQTAMISIMSVAGVFVLSAGQIDLTVGSNTAMSAMLVALVLKSTNNIFLALIVALIFGVAVGVINGLLVTRLGLPAFLERRKCRIITAVMKICRSVIGLFIYQNIFSDHHAGITSLQKQMPVQE